MLSLNPLDRLSCKDYLLEFGGTAFPTSFYTFLHPFVLNLQKSTTPPPPPPPPPAAAPARAETLTAVQPGEEVRSGPVGQVMRTDADEIIETLWNDFDYIARQFGANDPESVAAPSSSSVSGLALTYARRSLADVPTEAVPAPTAYPGLHPSPAGQAESSSSRRRQVLPLPYAGPSLTPPLL